MSHSDEMIKQLQPFQRNSKVYKAIFEAESSQLDSRDAVISDLQLQLSVDTATWALSIYEIELSIPTDTNKPYADRRAVIKSKMRGTGKVDAALIKAVADAYTFGNVNVDFDGTIIISFTSVIGVPPNINDLKLAIDEIKPAHLAVLYVYRYILISELNGMTITELNSTKIGKFAGEEGLI